MIDEPCKGGRYVQALEKLMPRLLTSSRCRFLGRKLSDSFLGDVSPARLRVACCLLRCHAQRGLWCRAAEETAASREWAPSLARMC